MECALYILKLQIETINERKIDLFKVFFSLNLQVSAYSMSTMPIMWLLVLLITR